MSGYSVARLDEIDEIDDGRVPWRPVRHHLGMTSFGMNAFTAPNAGDRLINEHDESHDASEEVYLVTQGRARFELDGEHLDAPAGTFVFVRSEVTRTAFAEEPGTTLLAVGGVPGKAYEPSGWEIWAPLNKSYQAGDYETVAVGLREAVEENPQYAGLLYNLACVESLTGRTPDAIDHLRRAIDMSDQYREYAKGDTDFDAIRGEPGFKELVPA
jgi:mannose-6-phosphate isomerase-like protein (cupin superfamily)